MALMKPKEITLTSNVNGEKETRVFNIGRYNGFDGIPLITAGGEILDLLARKKTETDIVSKKIQSLLRQQGVYIEWVTDNGNVSLDTGALLKSALPDVDIALKLMREVHDHNTEIFNTASLLNRYQKAAKQAQGFITKISGVLSDTLSAKNSRK